MRNKLMAAAIGSAVTVVVIGVVALLAYREREYDERITDGIW